MNIFSNRTLNGNYHKFLKQILDNWYEDRLAVEQEYRAKPDLRHVSYFQ